MKAVVVNRPGGSEVLEVVERPIPQVREGWSLIQVKGFGVNRSEIFTRQGHSPRVTFPRVLGIECVGVIVETTDEDRLPLGQKVLSTMGEMGRAFDGSYAEYVLLPNEQIFPIETALDWTSFAAVPETFYTAYGSMLQLQLTSNDTVLVRGAASGVGISFTKLVKAVYPNLNVYGSVRHLVKEAQLLAVGYDGVILETNGTLETEKTFTKILELVGPSVIKDSISHLANSGIICCTGLLGGQWFLESFDPTFDLANNGYLTTFYSGNVSREQWQSLFDFLETYQVDVSPVKCYRIEEIRKAHDYLESSQAFGKVVIVNEG
ncbi:alcohol dehydrogenase catalytic domain-containing protein [Streptococcus sp. S784/96/1]|uniref:alcohol dehydrogenase catalytic domain-containing protein n=1 Tax=Streptococcus sp. S784/96/1 TaxID=2653499 RepID=UPI001386F29A|nr:zinc-binding dehydrogenase [Streptococcus sp. S784/96/1]